MSMFKLRLYIYIYLRTILELDRCVISNRSTNTTHLSMTTTHLNMKHQMQTREQEDKINEMV